LIYVDTSFLVSLYVPDQSSEQARKRIEEKPAIWLTPLHRAEWAHAISQHVFQRRISSREAQKVYRSFEQDRQQNVWLEIGMPEMAFERCVHLARRHVSRLGVRTLDSLHVACALELNAARFWTFDVRQRRLAEAEGLNVL
jgi:predicted nucleic acid-binding protein